MAQCSGAFTVLAGHEQDCALACSRNEGTRKRAARAISSMLGGENAYMRLRRGMRARALPPALDVANSIIASSERVKVVRYSGDSNWGSCSFQGRTARGVLYCIPTLASLPHCPLPALRREDRAKREGV